MTIGPELEREELAAVRAALAEAGVDPTDLGLFVNRVIPGVIEPSTFDERAAAPVLLEWLPLVRHPVVKEILARHLVRAGPRATRPLIDAFLSVPLEWDAAKWAIGDAIARTAGRETYDELVQLAADGRHGMARQMLVFALWRVKTPAARDVLLRSLDDEDVAFHAMSALRRLVGNEQARAYIAPLTDHQSADVSDSAREQLKRIDRLRAKAAR